MAWQNLDWQIRLHIAERAQLVSWKITKTPRNHTPRTEAGTIRRNTGEPDICDEKEDHLLDEEPEAKFTSMITSLAKPSGPQCRICLVCSTSNNKFHHHRRKGNCKRETQVAYAVTQKTLMHVPTATLPTLWPTSLRTPSISTVRQVIDSAVDPNQEVGTRYGCGIC